MGAIGLLLAGMSLGVALGVISAAAFGALPGQARKALTAHPDPEPLEAWHVHGIGEVLIQEIDHDRKVVLVTPEEGSDHQGWIPLEQILNRGYPLYQQRRASSSGAIDRVARMRERQ